MDSSAYRDLTTSRGITYHYYTSLARSSKPTLLFLHGFPSTSNDWRKQVAFFKDEGYGLIVPDMLGYGETAKPTDETHYRMTLVTADIIDILDAEGIAKAIAIGHDWGSLVVSRLAGYYSDRFTAFGFLAAPYIAPTPGVDALTASAYVKSLVGRELYGYWWFMSEDGGDKLIESKWESFRSILWPADPTVWMSDLCPTGGLKAWLTAGRTGPLPSYLTEEEAKQHADVLLAGGLAGPVCWYKSMVNNIAAEDDKAVPLDKYDVAQPVFFGGATKDYICLSALGKGAVAQRCKNSKTVLKEYDGDHWIVLSHAEALNEDLLAWIQSFESKKDTALL